MMTFLSLWLGGVLIAFSPCILPALPLIVAASLQRHPLGPMMMAFGLMIGFVFMGTILYMLSHWLSFSSYEWRWVAALIFILLGGMILIPDWHASILSPISNKAHQLTIKADELGIYGQIIIGFLLGIVWSPCVGPALGAIFVLVATQGSSLYAAFSFAVFALGAAMPLLLIAYGGRHWVMKSNSVLRHSNQIMGGVLLLLGISVILQLDLWLQAILIRVLPDFWLNAVTAY